MTDKFVTISVEKSDWRVDKFQNNLGLDHNYMRDV